MKSELLFTPDFALAEAAAVSPALQKSRREENAIPKGQTVLPWTRTLDIFIWQ